MTVVWSPGRAMPGVGVSQNVGVESDVILVGDEFPDGEGRRRWLWPAVVALSAGVLGLLVLRSLSGDGEPTMINGAPDSPATPTESVSPTSPPDSVSPIARAAPGGMVWLDGVDRAIDIPGFAPAPPVPDGWQVMEYEDVRFAVPDDWAVAMSPTCVAAADGRPADGAVFIPQSSGGGSRCDGIAVPQSRLTIGHDGIPEADENPEAVDPNAVVGILPATRLADGSFIVVDRYRVTASGPDAEAILATFSLSGAQLLSDVALVDTSGWQRVTYRSVALNVPPDWTVVEMAAGGGHFGPGTCDPALFARQEVAFTGSSDLMPSCPATIARSLAPADGVWLHDNLDAGQPKQPLADGQLGGMDAVRVGVERNEWPSPVIDIVIDGPGGSVWLTLGVGLDPAVAATILSTVRPE